jgi:PKD repeat protein
MLRTFRILILALFALVAPIVFAADAEPAPNLKTHPLAGKVDHRLLPQVLAIRAKTATDAQAAKAVTAVHTRAVTAKGDATQLGVRIDTTVTPETLKAIAATGATIVSSAPQWNAVCVMATPSQISALADVGAVNQIKLLSKPHHRQQGAQPDEADGVMKTDLVRTNDGLTGAGQTVGVISDSVTDTAAVGHGNVNGTIVTGTNPQSGTHDLPASFQVVNFGPGGGTDEGEAMMEEIYDIAPGAALAFGSCGIDQTQMATTLTQLRTNANCTVTVDDIGFADEPFFQDGPIAQAITANRTAGIPHFSAFGNDGNQGILTTYQTIKPAVTIDDGKFNPTTGDCFHDWGNGLGAFLPVTIPSGVSVNIILQWDQPFSTMNLGAGSNADLDMYLITSKTLSFSSSSGIVAGSSEQIQGIVGSPSGDPEEFIQYTNSSAGPQTLFLVVNHFGGSRTSSTGSGGNVMRIVFDDDGQGTLPDSTAVGVNQMSTYGHPTAASCIGVGAIFFGVPSKPEYFTSKGGNIPFYFTPSGAASASTRFGPDLAAPDGISSSVFQGGGPGAFFGTSCAAPNAAAVAALLLQAQAMSPSQLQTLMQNSATDITLRPPSPSTDTTVPMGGADAYTGFGLVNADQAYKTFGPPTITSSLTATANVGSVFTYTIGATGVGTLTFGATVSAPLSYDAPTHTISGIPTAAGPISIPISVSNPNGTTNASVSVTVGGPVPVNISGVFAAANPTILGDVTTFTVSATGSGRGFTYSWDFGDGGTSTSAPPVQHTYATLGSKTATVTVTDLNGQSDIDSVTFPIIPPQIVIGQVPTATPNPTFTTLPIQFSAAASGGIPPLTYAWDFGDGGTSTALTPTHTYTAAGQFNVSFTVTDSAAQTKKLNLAVQVATFTTLSFPSAPSANISVSGPGQSVSFSSSSAGNGTLTYAWDFGDGATASGANVSHVYASAGSYTVTVTVTDVTHQTLSKTLTIKVNAPLIGTGLDSDGDGVSDAVELLAGTNPNDPTSSPVGAVSATPGPLTISKVQVKLNFSRQENDSIAISGTLAIPAGLVLDGSRLIYNVGGIQDGLTLDKKGHSNAGTAEKFMVQVKSTKGVIAAQTAKFTLTLSRTTFSTQLADFGFVNATSANVPVTLPIQFIFNGAILETDKGLTYSAKAGKTGSAK